MTTDEEAKYLDEAIRLAVIFHNGQRDKAGLPYILHPLRLMGHAKTASEKMVAVLHDVLEDTEMTRAFLDGTCLPSRIVIAVETLTRGHDEAYEEFIERIAKNPLAARVKLLDLYDNIDITRLPELGPRDIERTMKYHGAIQRLKEVV